MSDNIDLYGTGSYYPLETLFTDRAKLVLEDSKARRRRGLVQPVDILESLLGHGSEGVWSEALESIGVTAEAIRERIRSPVPRRPRSIRDTLGSDARVSFGSDAMEVMKLSVSESRRLGQFRADCAALLLGLIDQGDHFAGQILIGLGAGLERTRREVKRLLRQQALRFGRNLTQAATDGELFPVVGREREIDRILHILFRHPLHIPVLIGKPGVGKTSVVHGLAQRIAANKVPETFAGTQVIQLDLLAARQAPDEATELISQMLAEGITQRDVLVVLDNREWTQPPKPRLGELRVIGVTNERGDLIPLDLGRMLVPVTVEETSVQETVQILESRRERSEERYQLTVTDRALAATARYAQERLAGLLPGKAIELLDEAAILGHVRGLGSIDDKTVAEAVANMLGVVPGEIVELPRSEPAAMTADHDAEIWGMS